MAADASFAVESGGSRARAEALRESLKEELDSAKRAAAAAAAARLRGQEEVARLEQQLASVQQQQATPGKASFRWRFLNLWESHVKLYGKYLYAHTIHPH